MQKIQGFTFGMVRPTLMFPTYLEKQVLLVLQAPTGIKDRKVKAAQMDQMDQTDQTVTKVRKAK